MLGKLVEVTTGLLEVVEDVRGGCSVVSSSSGSALDAWTGSAIVLVKTCGFSVLHSSSSSSSQRFSSGISSFSGWILKHYCVFLHEISHRFVILCNNKLTRKTFTSAFVLSTVK